MAPKFGTSGLRGLVSELSEDLVRRYVRAFIAACPQGRAVHVGWDLRPSSPAIADAVIAAIRAAGLTAVSHGAVPTPALAMTCMAAGDGAVMITGSHIPADRNGLKFYVPDGEISKDHETAIVAALEVEDRDAPGRGDLRQSTQVLPDYVDRYLRAFGPEALSGLRIGVYEHSSVARDVMTQIMRGLGARTVSLARSDVFIPVDTEAVDPDTRLLLAGWARDHGLDAIVSTDGDGDRPMLAGSDGALLQGDVLGPVTARLLGADTLVTPVSSNTLVDRMEEFDTIVRTRIGSPFVISAMEQMLAQDPACKVVGYEANGGFLLGFTAQAGTGTLKPLMTRDSLLPLVAPLAAARAAGQDLRALAADLPARFTASDRVQGIASDRSAALIAALSGDKAARAGFFEGVGAEQSVDLTDGLRVRFAQDEIVHLRGSGNAPECRCYAEASDARRAQELLDIHLTSLKAAFAPQP
ncbi:Phosphoglucosamine mutase (plasmid) [Roseovarius sp. THAF27]|uniref:phosphomannomutase n=1 Tax=unclassified Roseovarius TaxID=2614913 RepID=UPI00126860CA|nr:MULTISPECIES: phosphomannomutase [unclassified Roseovarius]QFT83293.1 Phosphoglucosamine mutase [Roseovarius sp. THAF27]QFT99945.1 Phosphoglucosamine mutase [Roseovarius sp. THAF8]